MLTPGVDSFVTLEEADAYFARHMMATTWAAFTDDTKEGGLLGAYDRITAACICDFASPYTAEEPPPQIKKAQYEWALLLLIAETAEISDAELTSLTAGPVNLKFENKNSSGNQGLNDFIKALLKTGGCTCSFSGITTAGNISVIF